MRSSLRLRDAPKELSNKRNCSPARRLTPSLRFGGASQSRGLPHCDVRLRGLRQSPQGDFVNVAAISIAKRIA